MAIFAVSSSLLLSPLFLFLVVYSSVFSPSVAHFDANEWSEKRYGICELPLKFGNCTEKLPRFYYDTTRRRCFKFLYTGCNGNSNRFRTQNHCKRKCHPDFRMSAVFQSEQKKIAESERQRKECAQNCGKAGGKCVNGLCQCKSGYEKKDGKCIDSNECDWISCERNAKCVNLPGSFRCECRRNFAGSGFNCTKIRRICAQPFDVRYEHQCQPEQRWVPRFYFDFASAQCRHFWYGGCQFGSSQNFFQDKKNCETICGGYSQAEHFLDIAHSSAANAHQNIIQQQNKLQDPCLDPFDDTLRQHCAEGIWKRRYYFDAIMGQCRVFWMDMSCSTPRAGGSRSRNIFVHVKNCRRACEGKKENGREVETAQQQVQLEHDGTGELRRWPEWEEAWNTGGTRTAGFIQASFAKSTPTTTSSTSTTTTASSTLAQMPELANECALVRLSDHLALSKTAQERRLRLSRLKAKLEKSQRNNEKEWSQQQQSHRSTNKKDGQSEACLDPFDWNLAKSCGGSRWRTRFFYDAHDAKCRPFWNDGCTSQTRNNFREKETCRRKCEQSEAEQQWDKQRTIWASAQEVRAMVEETSPLLSSSAICAQPFDDIYRHGCNNGKSWTRKWYFDTTNGFCRHFWYDGCVGKSRNIFEGLKQCMDMCVNDKDFISMRRHSMRMGNQAKYAYFGSAQSTVLRPHKNYLKSAEIWLNEKQCAGFRYNMSGNALLSAFLCLLEEGGSCQRTVHRATNGREKCHFARSWLKGRHSYAWFFTMEKRRGVSPNDESSSIAPNESPTTTKVPPSSTDADHLQTELPKTTAPTDKAELLELVEQQQRIEWTASAVLTLHQPQLNTTESLVVPIDLFGRHNETVATVELFIAPIEQCNGDTKC